MPFAQLVVGAPGAGKSTYCDGMQQFMAAIERPCAIVNLDPANDHTSYPAALDVRDLVTVDEVMEQEELGPNGGMIYALEELEHNFEWLEQGLRELGDRYVLFDCPGQVELFTHHDSLRNIFFRLQKLGYRLVVISMTDSYVLTQPSLYVSAMLLALRSMLQLDLPHLNVLTKIDKLASYGPLAMPLRFYTEARSLEYLEPHLAAEQRLGPGPTSTNTTPATGTSAPDVKQGEGDEPTPSKFHALNKALLGLVEDYALVGFETLAVEDRSSMLQLLRAIDRAGGYAFGGTEGINESAWGIAMREGGLGQPGHMEVADIEERWITRRDEFDDAERKQWQLEGDAEREAVKLESGRDEAIGSGHRDSGIKVVRKGPT